MFLNESEGKELLKRAGLLVPHGFLVKSVDELTGVDRQNLRYPLYAKAQVFHGGRGLQDLVRKADDWEQLKRAVGEIFLSTDQFDQPITTVLVEESVVFDQEMYLSLTYDTRQRSLVAQFSYKGGVEIESHADSISQVNLSAINEPSSFSPEPKLLPTVQKLWALFKENDATLVEINPIVRKDDQYYCLDAKIELEDSARFRHGEWSLYRERTVFGRPPTELEKRARLVNDLDHRGSAGASFFEFISGNVGVLASGGGASQLAMDALITAGVEPANYTEYSGNPTREKVKALTEVVLSIANLKGLYVVGSNANFTDIYDTLAGVIDALLESKYKDEEGFALLVRRGGPRYQEAFAMIRERLSGTGVRYKLFGPDFSIIETAKEMKKLMNQ